jgi:hypothetical protein
MSSEYVGRVSLGTLPGHQNKIEKNKYEKI